MRRLEENPAEAISAGLLAANTGVKHAYFRFFEMALTNMEKRGFTD